MHFTPITVTTVIVWWGQWHQEKRLVKKSLLYHRFEKYLKMNVLWDSSFLKDLPLSGLSCSLPGEHN